ncbi:MAG: LacI family DNA-binding transcriptional regulator [Bacteroidales bacterium]|nr:LacI family DNA-binding transcriptional regulator [Bacteroidales bacterium]
MDKHLTRVRISDIARRAGVSAGTVDRVLHNRGEVSEKTRNSVLEILRELNYEPDILASTLASRKTLKLASLTPEPTNDSLFWKEPEKGFDKALNQVKHYGIEFRPFCFNYFENNSFKNALEKLTEWSPDGIVMVPSFSDLTTVFLSKCQEKNIPVVFLNMNLPELPNISFVGQDPLRSGMVAARLLDFGLKQNDSLLIINIMSDKVANKHLLTREEGFRSFFINEGKVKRKKLSTLNISGSDRDLICSKLKEAINPAKKGCIPSGIFVTNSRVFHVADYLYKNGISDITLIGYDLLEANITHLKNNTINFLIGQNPVEQGYRSLMALFDTLIMKKRVPACQYLPIDIITKENIDYYLTDQINE